MSAITSTNTLHSQLIRLAHAHPEFRKDLLPLIQACDHTEGPMMGKYEEGVPADPTENMSPEDKKEWELNTLKNKDKFKQAEDEESDEDGEKKEAALRSQIIRLAHAHPEFRKDLLPLFKQAGVTKGKIAAATAIITKTIKLTVRITSNLEVMSDIGVAPQMAVEGQISIDFGGDIHPDAVRFNATIESTPKGYVIHAFDPKKTVSGGGAEMLVNVLRAAFQEALDTKGAQLLR